MRWNNGGVAFIGLSKDEYNLTIGRMYLITKQQFIDVAEQENAGSKISIDFNTVKRDGSKVFRKSWYGNIIYLGDKEGYPVFTFTHYKKLVDQKFNTPSDAYIRIIADGLRETIKLTEDEIVDYLIKKPGINKSYDKKQLKKLIN